MIIENDSKIHFVYKEDILAISVDSKIISLLLENGNVIYKTSTLKRVLELLPEFIQINRSCAVNKKKIIEISKKTRIIKLKNNKTYNVSVRQMPKLRLI